ncbi:hypothetical protein PTTG_28352 [Puccinia triticina 1-1 BBBD Race 1]|uniref:Uncharacterized protein n=1 Tax=Puccinia triticina (isolate 1-1 / race 1 (BBBD)) TaxID=630390 RepID=A0A180GCJ7_PUCT1|nr:hypothetical protein PTTG_28352 [Puccinia triticina 1-1 BBBD Race 1]
MDCLNTFKLHLINAMKNMYNSLTPPGGVLTSEDLFHNDEAEAIVFNLHNISTKDDIRSLIGGQSFSGQLDKLDKLVAKFKSMQEDSNTEGFSQKFSKLNGSNTQTPMEPNGSELRALSGHLENEPLLNGQPEPSGRAPHKTKREIAAEKRQQKAKEKALSLEREQKRKEQVAEIMAQTWEKYNGEKTSKNTDNCPCGSDSVGQQMPSE